MLEIDKALKESLKLVNSNALNDENFKKLVLNCFQVLTRNTENNSLGINALYGSKPDTVKEIYASILTIIAHFGRNDLNKSEVTEFLINECHFNTNRAAVIGDIYEENKKDLQVALGNVGLHLPHITDLHWKMDYVLKTSSLEQASGPIFRINLITEVFNEELGQKIKKPVNFTCTLQELQDLVYKLKDAVRHCERLSRKPEVSDNQ